MGVVARQRLRKSGFDDSLASLNNGAGYIETDFMLGDQMTLEVCFKKMSTVMNDGNMNDGLTFVLPAIDEMSWKEAV